ncbi:MAG TPA: DCC1-like thiol-disulfide oxidoreductase family protein [Vicinamibacterales bacterium]|nr:DCC1-like thiol-disulfide oxidoreductase family protein [Vicinamibacterales bacterium]
MEAQRDGRSVSRSVVLFDGVCNLCNATVTFVIARDPSGRFQFATLGSDAARALLRGAAAPETLPDSIVLVDEQGVFTRSTAALRIARRLSFPWPLAYAFILIPSGIRDWLYDWIASHRYRWFGRRETCMVPTPELRARFLN